MNDLLNEYLNNLTPEKALEFITAYESSNKFKQVVDTITENADNKDLLDKIIDFIKIRKGQHHEN